MQQRASHLCNGCSSREPQQFPSSDSERHEHVRCDCINEGLSRSISGIYNRGIVLCRPCWLLRTPQCQSHESLFTGKWSRRRTEYETKMVWPPLMSYSAWACASKTLPLAGVVATNATASPEQRPREYCAHNRFPLLSLRSKPNNRLALDQPREIDFTF
jgi:hypothetical protein